MSLPEPATDALADLDALEAAGLAAFEEAGTLAAVEAARIEFLGLKQGRVKAAQERLKSLEPSAKPTYGQRFNAVKGSLESAHEAAKSRVSQPADMAIRVDANASAGPAIIRITAPTGQASGTHLGPIDVTLPGDLRHPILRGPQSLKGLQRDEADLLASRWPAYRGGSKPRLGHRHPLTQTTDELIDLFGRFGFAVARGPEVEDVHHNFDALNIPQVHPARDPLDNFYLPDGTMLRSQTSTVQVRVMESQPPPVRVIAIGRVYRPDTVDATHSFMFHQIEGLMVDRGVTMADLKTVLRLFARSYLGRDVKIRFRPSFFPFTEPSVEVDMLWHGGDRWVEMGGAGMVDPNVFRAVGYDPDEVTGFAFGLGIERLCMRRHGIDDIRLLYQNDARFLAQF